MDRNNRESRRVTVAASNGLSRRRHRSSSLRDSPVCFAVAAEDDGPVELHETARLRDRGTGKRDRERDRDKERDRERERDRDRISSRSKRRRGDRMLHGNNREDGGDDTSEESVNDDEDEDEDDGDGVGAGPGSSSMRMLPPNPSSFSSSVSNHHLHRKSFPPPPKVFRTGPLTSAATTTVSSASWKAHDEMIGVSVPRKARSASTKRPHEWASTGAGVIGGGEQIQRQASTSPVRSTGPSVNTLLGSALASPAPPSPPSSSNASVKKKMKPNGPKQRPAKSLSTKSTSLAQEEIEMEIAEVLYGLMKQPQAPIKQDSVVIDSLKFDSREINNVKPSSADAKSSISSPISNSASTIAHSSSILPLSSSISPTGGPMSATAPKRKRPRPVKYEDENQGILSVRSSPISSTVKVDNDQPTKTDSPLLNVEKSSSENGAISFDLMANQAVLASKEQQQSKALKFDNNNLLSDFKPKSESEESGIGSKEELRTPKKESSHGIKLDEDRESLTASKAISKVSKIEMRREEKFQIDLMAPPPSRSSPERDSESVFVAVDPNAKVSDLETESKPSIFKKDDKLVEIAKEDVNVEPEKKTKVIAEEVECRKPISNKERNVDVQLDLEKTDRDAAEATLSGNKLLINVQMQQQQLNTDKAAQPSSLPLPMSVANWPAGLPHMGYVAPLQGVVSMDGCSVPSAAIQPPHLLFSQPRPKRCATHCYIARNIHCHQQFMRMNPFWPAAAGTALQYGAKAGNVNAAPSTEMHAVRGANSLQDKSQSLAVFPGHSGKDKNSQTSIVLDTAQRNQILLKQTIPPGTPSNILHGPAFIFPLSQQQAASVRPGSVKSTGATGTTASSQTSSSASVGAAASGLSGATAMSFNYPNMSGNEAQYLAILQNGAYPIPIPAHVGAPPAYRGTHPQPMPFFNGSFYSSQMLHPSQLQHQQPPHPQSQQSQLGHQNPSISSGSSPSQKHFQSQQQLPHSSGFNSSSGNFQGFPAPKVKSMPPQHRQPVPNQNSSHQTRQLDSELGGEDSPSTADSRISHATVSHYGQNFAMPMPPPNFTLVTAASVGGGSSANGNLSDKKQQQPQQHGSKAGTEVSPTQALAMSFASINSAASAPGTDIASLAQNHAFLQSLPEATRHSFQFMAAAASAQAAAQQKKNYRVSEDSKPLGNDASIVEEERKVVAVGKAPATTGHSIAFSRTDFTNMSVPTMPANSVIDNAARTLHHAAVPARVPGPVVTPAVSTLNTTSGPHLQRNQPQQQIIQLHKQHQFAAAAATGRSKPPVTSNGSVYSDHTSSSSSMASKFPSALSAFPQSVIQGNSGTGQSPQWKSSARTGTSQIPSPSLTPAPSVKSPPQQPSRNQQNHTHISFAANAKTSVTTQGQPPSSGNPSPSSPLVVGSPTTSSISKSASGSPRTSTSINNKGGQSSSLSSQQAKNSPSVASQKSSPVGGRNIPSILGHPHNSSSSSSASKSQLPQQQQLPKHTLQPAHMLYPGVYVQSQPHHSASSTTNIPAASGFYIQRHRSEQQQQPQGSSTSSSGMLSLCPSVTPAGTTDPAKAVAAAAAAASNMKGGGLHSQGFIHAQFAAAQPSGKPHQLLPAGFPYVHAVPTAVQVKPAEHKQPAGE